MDVPYRQIRAAYTDTTVRVYQAYRPEIAVPAVEAQRFVPPFKRERMTWIKPSFLWMMYRCGYATKPGQEHVLAVDIARDGFEWALAHACLSHFDADVHADHDAWARRLRESPVRIQWDPERDFAFNALPYRSVQIGLAGEAVRRYVDEWTVAITDVTEDARAVHAAVRAGDLERAAALLPPERPYPLPSGLADAIAASREAV
ncbi:DUF4291 domain-containing protein [Thermopolyspora sp. NPDC052614]|uniref:DUF4291 domain-containing protein n=1 Tax=Thermopolyspora sp. NPDC052614 TaxID=3155682 RepID=UPI003445B769